MKYIFSMLLLLLTATVTVNAQPAMYTVQGKHNVLHLIGTVHMLQSTDALPENFSKAYADASQLLMEVDTSAMDPMALQELMLTAGMLPEDETLESYVGAATYIKVKSAAKEAGLGMDMLDHMRPWLAALTLEEVIFAKMGFDPNSGIEMQLTKRAAQDHKVISGLETMNEQISLFANLNKKTELEYLTNTLEELGTLRNDLNELVNAWRRGDESKLSSLLQKEMAGHEQFYDVLIYQRNKRWINQLTNLLENGDDNYLVAVGALHLVCDNGVVALLRKAGYKVSRD